MSNVGRTGAGGTQRSDEAQAIEATAPGAGADAGAAGATGTPGAPRSTRARSLDMQGLGLRGELEARLGAAGPAAAAGIAPAFSLDAPQRGTSGQAVFDIQAKLKDTGFTQEVPDGKFGPKTQAAVADFQRSYDLPQTGHVDAKTLEEIDKAFNDVTYKTIRGANVSPAASRLLESLGGSQSYVSVQSKVEDWFAKEFAPVDKLAPGSPRAIEAANALAELAPFYPGTFAAGHLSEIAKQLRGGG